ncbi:unnamed protein product [Thelazia callipaeda]|uniref:SH3 domain-containing protein n=1 Tax=Thelazia callipaeda TaxID=103827 RepID=A0A0N5DCJ6_THECL|nr:unnamed protein product [Thelazia callipaeda]
MAIVAGETNLRFTDRDSSHCRILVIKEYQSDGRYIEFESDEVPKGDGVLIPKMFGAYVDYLTITEKRFIFLIKFI